MFVAKESGVTERMVHRGGEQIQGNETRNCRDRGRESAKRRGGGWASWTAQALFAWTRTHDEPGKSETCGYIAAGLLRADVSFVHRARLRGSGLLAPRRRMAMVACSMPASVYSRVARKRKFSTLSLRSAVENGSFFSFFLVFFSLKHKYWSRLTRKGTNWHPPYIEKIAIEVFRLMRQ